MRSLSEACHTAEENVLMILAMNDLEGQEWNPGDDGVEAMIRGFVARYSKDGDNNGDNNGGNGCGGAQGN